MKDPKIVTKNLFLIFFFIISFTPYSQPNSVSNYINIQKIRELTSSRIPNSSGNRVLLQGFFWEVPDDGNWWNLLNEEAFFLNDAGGALTG